MHLQLNSHTKKKRKKNTSLKTQMGLAWHLSPFIRRMLFYLYLSLYATLYSRYSCDSLNPSWLFHSCLYCELWYGIALLLSFVRCILLVESHMITIVPSETSDKIGTINIRFQHKLLTGIFLFITSSNIVFYFHNLYILSCIIVVLKIEKII